MLVSAGFDAHAADPLGGLLMTSDGFAALGAIVRDAAARTAAGRVAMMLEGGYHLGALAEGTRACVDVLAGADAPDTGGDDRETVDRILDDVRAAHGNRWDLG